MRLVPFDGENQVGAICKGEQFGLLEEMRGGILECLRSEVFLVNPSQYCFQRIRFP